MSVAPQRFDEGRVFARGCREAHAGGLGLTVKIGSRLSPASRAPRRAFMCLQGSYLYRATLVTTVCGKYGVALTIRLQSESSTYWK